MRSPFSVNAVGLAALGVLLFGIGLADRGAHAAEEAGGLHLEIGYQHVFHDGGADVAADGSIALSDVSLAVAVLRAGYDVAKHVMIEGEAMMGLSDGSGAVNAPEGNIPFEIGLDYGFAVFGKVWYPAFEGGTVHARLGAAAIRIKSSVPGYSSAETSENLAYGVGGEIALREDLCLRADLTQYRDSGETIEGVSVSLVYHF